MSISTSFAHTASLPAGEENIDIEQIHSYHGIERNFKEIDKQLDPKQYLTMTESTFQPATRITSLPEQGLNLSFDVLNFTNGLLLVVTTTGVVLTIPPCTSVTEDYAGKVIVQHKTTKTNRMSKIGSMVAPLRTSATTENLTELDKIIMESIKASKDSSDGYYNYVVDEVINLNENVINGSSGTYVASCNLALFTNSEEAFRIGNLLAGQKVNKDLINLVPSEVAGYLEYDIQQGRVNNLVSSAKLERSLSSHILRYVDNTVKVAPGELVTKDFTVRGEYRKIRVVNDPRCQTGLYENKHEGGTKKVTFHTPEELLNNTDILGIIMYPTSACAQRASTNFIDSINNSENFKTHLQEALTEKANLVKDELNRVHMRKESSLQNEIEDLKRESLKHKREANRAQEALDALSTGDVITMTEFEKRIMENEQKLKIAQAQAQSEKIKHEREMEELRMEAARLKAEADRLKAEADKHKADTDAKTNNRKLWVETVKAFAVIIPIVVAGLAYVNSSSGEDS